MGAQVATYVVNANDAVPGWHRSIYQRRIYSVAIMTGTSFSAASLTGNYVTEATGSSTGNASCNGGGNCAKSESRRPEILSGTGTPNSTKYHRLSIGRSQTTNPSGTVFGVHGRVAAPAIRCSYSGDAQSRPNFGHVIYRRSRSSATSVKSAGANLERQRERHGEYSYSFGSIDPGDSTFRNETGAVKIDSSGNITGFQYKSDTSTGLISGSINSGGGSSTPTISNSPFMGIASVGGGIIAVTNGT